MPKYFVCLSFDVDNRSSAIAKGQVGPVNLSRGDFGVVGTARILNLLAEFDIRATWFVPGHTIESYPASVGEIVSANHEISHHGWTHRSPSSLTAEEEAEEIERGNQAIRKLTGTYPRGYRAPGGELSKHTIELLKKSGFLYDSSMMADDYLPYQLRDIGTVSLSGADQPGAVTNLVEMPISWSLDDWAVFEQSMLPGGIIPGLRNSRGVEENWTDDFIYMQENLDWGIMTLICHPHVIGRGHRMMFLKRMIEFMVSRGATFVTLEDAVSAYRQRYPQGRALSF
jgi:peptidoglycan/xylan/chitin deacetylase (PgdA/CDA1 family)